MTVLLRAEEAVAGWQAVLLSDTSARHSATRRTDLHSPTSRSRIPEIYLARYCTVPIRQAWGNDAKTNYGELQRTCRRCPWKGKPYAD